MAKHTQGIDIDASVSRVWEVVTDTARWSQWRASVRRIEVSSKGCLESGVQGVIVGSGEAPSVRFRVVEHQPPRVLSYQTSSPGQRTRVTYAIDAKGTGCHVASSAEVSGPLGRLLGALGGAVIRRDLGGDAERLKLICERTSQ